MRMTDVLSDVAAGGLEGRLVGVFDSVADGVTVLDRNGVVRFANVVAAQLMGKASPADVIGRSGSEILGDFEILDTSGQPLDPGRIPTRRALAGEVAPEEVVRFRRRGSLDDRWSLVRARLLPGATSDEDLVVSCFQDITSVKRGEARLRFLANASSILGESLDYGETLARVAQMAVPELADWCVADVLERNSGVVRAAVAHSDPAKVALAEEASRRWPPDPTKGGAVHEMLRRREPLHVPEVTEEILQSAAQDDEHLALLRRLEIRSVVVVPLMAREEVVGALSLVHSESQRRWEPDDIALAAELGRRAGAAIDASRLLWEAQENAKVRDEFIAVASHDMRTPLAAIRGYAQLARRHVGREEAPDRQLLDRWLHDIDQAVDRLGDLVSELLDASLIRGGHAVPLQLAPTDLATLAGEVCRRHESIAPGHRFVVEAAEVMPPVMADPERLDRVLDNLVGNAVKFSPGGGEVRVAVGFDGERGYLAVADQGIGISPAERELIFAPAYRARNARPLAGSGLGLAGSKQLVEQMGGSITVESQVGRGSTFTVWLPLA